MVTKKLHYDKHYCEECLKDLNLIRDLVERLNFDILIKELNIEVGNIDCLIEVVKDYKEHTKE